MRGIAFTFILAALASCGDNAECDLAPFSIGDLDGHPDPLGASEREARAGRITAADLPAVRWAS